MERVAGRSLGAIVDAEGPLPFERWVRVAQGAPAGLAAAHTAGVVHGHLETDDVIVTSEAHPVLTDLGVVRLPDGASSESARGTEEDVLALGCVLFEAATGAAPWIRDPTDEHRAGGVEDAAIDVRELRPELPPEAADLLARCLSRDPAQRPTAQDVVSAAKGLARATPGGRNRPRAAAARRHTEPPPALSSPRRSSTKSVAVLPFAADVDADPGIVSGITAVVIESLARVEALRVRTSGHVEGRRDAALGRAELGRVLDARVLVEGRVRMHGPLVAVAIKAFSAADDLPVWAARFSCEVGQLFTLGDAIATGLAAALAESGPPSTARPPDGRVAELLLRARGAYNAFWHDEASTALTLLEQAVALAPKDPVVLASWALAALRVTFFTGEALDTARAAAERATAVAPDAPEVLVARASIALQDGDLARAVPDARRAVALAPELAEAQALLGRILIEADELARGTRHLEWAVALEPMLAIARWDLARAYALVGRWDDVDRAARAGDAPAIGHEASRRPAAEGAAERATTERVGRWLDGARHAAWRWDGEAARRLLAMIPTDDVRDATALARAILALVAHGTSPLETGAWAAFRRQGAASRRRAAFVAQIEAEVAALEGRRGDAVASVVTAAAAGLTDLAWLTRCPLLAGLRDTPAYATAVREVTAGIAAAREALIDG